MKKLFVIISLSFFSISMFAQTVESAIKRMNMGDYESALVYWKALNVNSNNYSDQITICESCIALQKQAISLLKIDEYGQAIEKYQAILAKNPSDENTKSQVEKCREYLAANQLYVYTNSTYGYSIKYPAYFKKANNSTNENVVFWTSDYSAKLAVKVTLENATLSNTVLFEKIMSPYKESNITYKSTKDNWIVISGYLSNGKTFYDKTFVVERKSQYNETIKVLVSACAITSKTDTWGSKLAKIIHKELSVSPSGNVVKVIESDDSRWQKALNRNTKEAYDNYLKYAPYSSMHKSEAEARRAIIIARNYYDRKFYSLAKDHFEKGRDFLGDTDKEKYAISFYEYCKDYRNSVAPLKEFIQKFPTRYFEVNVIKGQIVKVYCELGNYAEAKEFVKNNTNVWYDASTSYTNKQWNEYINNHKKIYGQSSKPSKPPKTTPKTYYSEGSRYKKPSRYFYCGEEYCLGLYTTSGFRDAELGGYFARYIGGFYVEGYMHGALKASEITPILWVEENAKYDVPSQSFLDKEYYINDTYKSFSIGCNLGYGFIMGMSDRFMITPYSGISTLWATGSRLGDKDGPYADSTAPPSGLALTWNLGVKFNVALADIFDVYIAPEYCLGVAQTSLQKSLIKESPTIRSWGNGLKLKFGLGFIF